MATLGAAKEKYAHSTRAKNWLPSICGFLGGAAVVIAAGIPTAGLGSLLVMGGFFAATAAYSAHNRNASDTAINAKKDAFTLNDMTKDEALELIDTSPLGHKGDTSIRDHLKNSVEEISNKGGFKPSSTPENTRQQAGIALR